jgi:uncharacterized protein (DUF2384 family)
VSNLSRSWLWALIVIPVGAVALAGNLGLAQWIAQAGTQVPIGTGQIGALEHTSRMPDEEPYATREIQERQMKRLREEHQHQLIDDTARLVQLATALKAEVDKGNQPALPTDVLKQADEISKLAKRVSERIKTQ